jgi:hypothetical protein
MSVIILYGYNQSIELERRRKTYGIAEGDFVEYFLKKQKEGIKWKNEDYTDCTEHHCIYRYICDNGRLLQDMGRGGVPRHSFSIELLKWIIIIYVF